MQMPDMRDARTRCASVIIPNCGIMVLGGVNTLVENGLESVELLEGATADNLRWRNTTPMLALAYLPQ